MSTLSGRAKNIQKLIHMGLVVGQEKDLSLFLDRTGEPAMPHRDSSRLKNKDTSFSRPTTHPNRVVNNLVCTRMAKKFQVCIPSRKKNVHRS